MVGVCPLPWLLPRISRGQCFLKGPRRPVSAGDARFSLPAWHLGRMFFCSSLTAPLLYRIKMSFFVRNLNKLKINGAAAHHFVQRLRFSRSFFNFQPDYRCRAGNTCPSWRSARRGSPRSMMRPCSSTMMHVGIADGGQPVGDDEHRAALHQADPCRAATSASVRVSMEEVASSRISTGGSATAARAMASSWRWPWRQVCAVARSAWCHSPAGRRRDEAVAHWPASPRRCTSSSVASSRP